ncbi:lipase/esterase [Coprinopsis sp. MPI-PUGE-AT-0042]|nr:lipase/esterase [Coprinopsis sp. MPI-PUGE-AT-0042]
MPLANALTTEVGFKVGPVLLEVLAKHYFDKRKETEDDAPKLRQDNILYDEAFTIIKAFLNAASWHTVEDIQAFSNTRTPSPPWIQVVRTIVPMSCCDQAATHMVTVLGGEDHCRKVVGGIKWWQVRGIAGVDAQWIVAKKDWREAKRRHKQRGEAYPASNPNEEGTYVKDMDAMRCILYLHGGGYYFGSVDQERYSIQRLARKINGRVFAINYRLAPQYPFPCAIQDALAAYLYLISPPAGAEHQPVDPSHIVISGDSAGGGLSLALLQVIRDAGLPAPSGGVLISPWCDLTHSFPSIHLNTKTDVIPDCGLSFHKPSPLWPPPPPEVSDRVHASIRHRVMQVFRADDSGPHGHTDTVISGDQRPDVPGLPVDVGSTTALPRVKSTCNDNIEKIRISVSSETLEVDQQIQFYTRNSLLLHPLVSPAFSYLGDLPPLLFIASDKEVLRDEIIYAAHRASDPSKFPIKQSARDLYPALNAYTTMKPTSVHLQVYDDTAHVLPILFAFTTPAKFCFRAMANFVKLVTEMPLSAPVPPSQSSTTYTTQEGVPSVSVSEFGEDANQGTNGLIQRRRSAVVSSSPLNQSRPSLRRALSSRMSRASGFFQPRSYSGTLGATYPAESPSPMGSEVTLETPKRPQTAPGREGTGSTDVAGPRFGFVKTSSPPPDQPMAGETYVYQSIQNVKNWECGMIRERVSTEGFIHPLEPAEELECMKMPEEVLGRISELALRRYIDTQRQFDKKYSHTYKSIDKQRRKNIERAKLDTIKRMSKIKKTLKGREDSNGAGKRPGEPSEVKDQLLSKPGWSYAWVFDEGESPPPSSIAARRDTNEARQLAELADNSILEGDRAFSGNNLWSIMVNFFTVTPDRSRLVPPSSIPEDASTSSRRLSFSRLFKFYNREERHPQPLPDAKIAA